MDAVINDTYKGNIKPADYQAKLDKLVQDTSKKQRIKSKEMGRASICCPISSIFYLSRK